VGRSFHPERCGDVYVLRKPLSHLLPSRLHVVTAEASVLSPPNSVTTHHPGANHEAVTSRFVTARVTALSKES